MRLRHIEVFYAVYTTGSITNAAKILHVSQPSVSKVLGHAEMQLGFQLFKRLKGRLLPTKEADMLFSEVDKIYHQLRSVKNTSENIKKHEYGNINLGITPALGFQYVPKAVAAFQIESPHVNFQLQTVHNEAILQTLLERKCDVACLFSPNIRPGLSSITLAKSELVIVYPKSMFAGEPTQLSLDQLRDKPFIDIGDSGPLGDLLWARLMEENVSLTSTIRVQTYFFAVRLVAQGVGLCVVDKFTALGNMDETMGMASFDRSLSFDVEAVYLENHALSNVARQFIDLLSETLSEG
ncbi:LysR family transcriptional regulator [Pseudoalteromonas sp. MMG005]|uniref:LysR family transcriptional regulator n=1 Tax=Pseudoalteromonas sp. MMG005 TaxID=2822682 RepID=UPI001B3A3FAF|nr:LysR family transcriptional regulator [Pseudoalteromonas sp. MMG005]MBQ4846026.1 LysR family transcriptional regulator [Pseudoalteromonas sp. MMG005]